MNKGSFDFTNLDSLGRSEMKKLMAGSDNDDCTETNAIFCQCSSGDPWVSRCATYDGSDPNGRCASLVCGPQLVFNASWGIDWFCGGCP